MGFCKSLYLGFAQLELRKLLELHPGPAVYVTPGLAMQVCFCIRGRFRRGVKKHVHIGACEHVFSCECIQSQNGSRSLNKVVRKHMYICVHLLIYIYICRHASTCIHKHEVNTYTFGYTYTNTFTKTCTPNECYIPDSA